MSPDLNLHTASAEDLSALYQEHGSGLSENQMRRRREPLRKIEVAPRTFQFRDPSHQPWAKEHHVRKLVQAFRRQERYFEPLLLFAVAGRRIVLDGHCRLQAYKRADLDPSAEVPVRYFRGSFREALTRPASENSKEKLPLTHAERLEAAWRLVLFDENRGNYSLRQIEEVTGAGKSTVGNMRGVLQDDAELGFDPRTRTWKEVKRGRREVREVDPDWEEKLAKAWAHRIRKQLGDKPNETPQVLFEALEIGYPQVFPHGIPREWAEDSGILNDLLPEQENFEF